MDPSAVDGHERARINDKGISGAMGLLSDVTHLVNQMTRGQMEINMRKHIVCAKDSKLKQTQKH